MLLSLSAPVFVENPHTKIQTNVGPIFDTIRLLDLQGPADLKKIVTMAIRQISLSTNDLATGYNREDLLYNLYCLEDMFDSIQAKPLPE